MGSQRQFVPFNVEVRENSFGPIFALFPQGNITQVNAPSTELIFVANDTTLSSLAEIVTNVIITPEIQGSTANTPVNDLISGLVVCKRSMILS